MKEAFLEKQLKGTIKITLDNGTVWNADKALIVSQIKAITDDYARQNYKLTLRQLYYQLVSQDAIPNNDKVYKKLSNILDDCRYSGYIDWEAIEDRGRSIDQAYYEEDVAGALERTLDYYKLNRQDGQDVHIEVWTEKDAISNIIKRAVAPYTIIMAVNKGYTSSSAIYKSYKRFSGVLNEGKKVVVLYFGDHDPSGLDMIRDIYERHLLMFCNGEQIDDLVVAEWINEYGSTTNDDKLEFIKENFKVVPIGLTMEQIKEYAPPPNPAKITDPRAAWYIKQHGKKSWEVDALKPEVMIKIVKDSVLKYISEPTYYNVLAKEKEDKAKLSKLIEIAKNGL